MAGTPRKTTSTQPPNILCLIVDSPNLIPWMPKRIRDLNVILLDFDADDVAPSGVRLDLNIVFNPIPVRRGGGTRFDYYIGSTAAEIRVGTVGGKIRQYTEGTMLQVGYSNTERRARIAELHLFPQIRVDDASKIVSAELGPIRRALSQEVGYNVTFASEERLLAPVLLDDTIRWAITLPRGPKAIRDFLQGNLYLYAIATWARKPRSGWIQVRPSDVRFFDSERKAISGRKSLFMQFVLWKRGIRIENQDGFTVGFKEA